MPEPLRTPCAAPGFADPAADAQRVFRALLAAMSRPGTIAPLDALPLGHGGLGPEIAALLLALADLDTPVWLAPEADSDEARAFLRFHCGSPVTDDPGQAVFAVFGDHRDTPDPDLFPMGSPEQPDRSATVLIRVPGLEPGPGHLRLIGPGVDGEALLRVPGLSRGWIEGHRANRALFPMGLDTVLAAPGALCCLPRSTRIHDHAGEDKPCT